jgi:hypothetical protein
MINLRRVLAGMFAVPGLVAVAALVAPAPVLSSAPVAPIVQVQEAQAADTLVNRATILNSYNSTQSLKVCHNWGSRTCSSGIRYLNAGEDTRQFGWNDSDGFYVPGDSKVYSHTGAVFYGPKWVQVHGCGGCVKTFRIVFK